MKFLNRLWAISGWVLFAYITVLKVATYGERWTFGRYFMPVTLTSPDGMHYLDGTPIEPMILTVVRGGCEEEIELTILGLIAAVFAYFLIQIWSVHRLLSSPR